MRRIVTGHDSDGHSKVVEDGRPPRWHDYTSVPDLSVAVLWSTKAGVPTNHSGADPTLDVDSVVPGPGETRAMRLVFPPDSAMMSPDIDLAAFGAEHMRNAPGLAELFEPDGNHKTPSIDYSILIEGELWLETDDGEHTKLAPGDVVVQNGTRHAWRNRSDTPAVMVSVLVGVDDAADRAVAAQDGNS